MYALVNIILFKRMNTHACMQAGAHAHTHTHTHTHMHTHACAHTHKHTRVCTHTFSLTHPHTQTHTHTVQTDWCESIRLEKRNCSPKNNKFYLKKHTENKLIPKQFVLHSRQGKISDLETLISAKEEKLAKH